MLNPHEIYSTLSPSLLNLLNSCSNWENVFHKTVFRWMILFIIKLTCCKNKVNSNWKGHYHDLLSWNLPKCFLHEENKSLTELVHVSMGNWKVQGSCLIVCAECSSLWANIEWLRIQVTDFLNTETFLTAPMPSHTYLNFPQNTIKIQCSDSAREMDGLFQKLTKT